MLWEEIYIEPQNVLYCSYLEHFIFEFERYNDLAYKI
jgi:hypothetical protein